MRLSESGSGMGYCGRVRFGLNWEKRNCLIASGCRYRYSIEKHYLQQERQLVSLRMRVGLELLVLERVALVRQIKLKTVAM